MNEGAIEQRGTPEEIYHRPRTAFAADFIGGANVLAIDVFRGESGWQGRLPDGTAVPLADSDGHGGRKAPVRAAQGGDQPRPARRHGCHCGDRGDQEFLGGQTRSVIRAAACAWSQSAIPGASQVPRARSGSDGIRRTSCFSTNRGPGPERPWMEWFRPGGEARRTALRHGARPPGDAGVHTGQGGHRSVMEWWIRAGGRRPSRKRPGRRRPGRRRPGRRRLRSLRRRSRLRRQLSPPPSSRNETVAHGVSNRVIASGWRG